MKLKILRETIVNNKTNKKFSVKEKVKKEREKKFGGTHFFATH